MDYGRKYFIRIMVYSSTFLAFYATFLILIILNFLEVIEFPIPLVATAFTIFDLCFVGIVLFIMILQGARINKLLMQQRTLVLEIKIDLLYAKDNLEKIIQPTFRSVGGNSKIIRAMILAQMEDGRKNEETIKALIRDVID